MAFHQRVSVAMGTSLQHLADSLFVHMSNLILLRRDSYLDFVKNGVKQDTMNLLRNAPLFGYVLFPDAAIVTAEQDIQKHETSSVAQVPGPGAPQHTSWRGSHRYRPYECRDKKASTSSDQTSSNNNLGDSSAGVVPGGVGADEVPALFSPSLTNTSPINDNYCVSPTPIEVNQFQLDLPNVQNVVVSRAQNINKLVSKSQNQLFQRQ